MTPKRKYQKINIRISTLLRIWYLCRSRELTFPTQGDKILASCVTLHSSSDGWDGGSVAAVAMYNTGRQRNLILHLYCPKWWQFGSDTSHSQPNHCVYKTQQCAPLSPVSRDILHTQQSVTLSFYSLSRRVVFIIAEVFFVVKIPRGQFKNPMQEEMTEVSH